MLFFTLELCVLPSFPFLSWTLFLNTEKQKEGPGTDTPQRLHLAPASSPFNNPRSYDLIDEATQDNIYLFYILATFSLPPLLQASLPTSTPHLLLLHFYTFTSLGCIIHW